MVHGIWSCALGCVPHFHRLRGLDRIVAMLTKLGQRGYTIHEESDDYRGLRNDTDADSDSDPEGSKPPANRQPDGSPNAAPLRRRPYRERKPIGIHVGVGIERMCMGFGHERLDVSRASIDYVGWTASWPC